ncbi:hypothetical protein NM208_g4398 [Fusarium decemcellulare]|uniref:Uncharacterized protein n=1 Tax=Fusarium decemcellulare TaxID=57161 RepID=A0ACC1SKQ1_9HYPO|nr:hypothetical protein NM208_g4398 [Fusarium decemcellulare]
MNKVFLVALSATGALASYYKPILARSPLLNERQVITIPCNEQGLKDCGTGCIETSWTCCPSKAGGCPPTAYLSAVVTAVPILEARPTPSPSPAILPP